MNGNTKLTTFVLASLIAGVAIGGVGVQQAMNARDGSGTLTSRNAFPAIPTQLQAPRPAPQTESSLATLADLDAQFSELVAGISPSVVHIRTDSGEQGSGVVYRRDGWIITNDHVVSGGGDVTVVLPSGKEYKGKVTRSRDRREDIAVIKIDAVNLTPAPLADSRDVRPGQYAIAVGAPFGLENTVTIGHVSALGRTNAAGTPGDWRSYENMIQTDAAINPGNSGGPLLNIRGQVIGINTAIYSGMSVLGGAQGNVGIGFAIPASQSKLIADLLIEKGGLERGYLGVAMEALRPFELDELGLRGGVRIADIPTEVASPAGTAGLKKGDIITRVGRTIINNPQDVTNAMLANGPGTRTQIEYLRGGQRRTADVKVIAAPQSVSARMEPRAPRNQMRPDFPGQEMPDSEEWLRNPDQMLPPGWRQRPEAPTERVIPGGPAKLGVLSSDISDDLREKYNIPADVRGAMLVEIQKGSAAERAGFKPGDVITELDGQKVTSAEELTKVVATIRVGERPMITRVRFGPGSRMQSTFAIQF